MQLRPSLRTGAQHQQADRLAAVAQGEHEQPHAPVLAAVRVAHHGTGAVIDLRLFPGGGLDDHASFRRGASLQLADEAPDALVTGVYQVLPDRHGVAATRPPEFDHLTVGHAGTGRGTATGLRLGGRGGVDGQLRPHQVGDHLVGRFCGGRVGAGLIGRFCRHRVGDHLVGRFCRRLPSPTAGWPEGDSGQFQIGGHRFATNTSGPLDPPQRPSQPPQS